MARIDFEINNSNNNLFLIKL